MGSNRFQIDSVTGVVTLNKALDREAEGAVYNTGGTDAVLRFKVMASAKGDLSKSSIVQVRRMSIYMFFNLRSKAVGPVKFFLDPWV